ncbi:hypothetical protein GCM10010492_00520 [Saccharothrix mutabilis subsp. mutabilis]|uniref:Uncharacterized protein n=1 Tax=Saccharothrix mutabilis subsp. mutabilis TaxID=66855 RepID=A0ABN0SYW4_9PSEU
MIGGDVLGALPGFGECGSPHAHVSSTRVRAVTYVARKTDGTIRTNPHRDGLGTQRNAVERSQTAPGLVLQPAATIPPDTRRAPVARATRLFAVTWPERSIGRPFARGGTFPGSEK